MSTTKKKNMIAEQINNILKPKKLVEDSDDDNDAKVEHFDENIERNNQQSEIRKQTAKSLSEIDSKYKGKVVSRKELEKYGDDESDSDEENLLSESEEEKYKEIDASDDSEESQSDVDSEEGSQDDDDDEDDEDFGECDISQFSTKNKDPVKINDTSQEEAKAVLLKKVSANDEVKKGICVQNQLQVWEKLLEVRIKAQKMLITANSFPNYDSFLELSEVEGSPFYEKIEDACDGIYNLLDNLLELQSTLIGG